MKKLHHSIQSLIWTLVLSVIFLATQACSGSFEKNEASSSASSQSTPPDDTTPTTSTGLKAVETYRIAHIREVLPSAVSILNTEPSTTLRQLTATMEANLSEGGESSSVSAPMVNSILTISGSACMDTITKERALASADRTIFKNFDFTKSPTAQPANAVPDLIRVLSRRAWLRNETDDERQMITDSLGLFATTTVSDTVTQALYICSAMTSSLDSLVR